MEVSSMENGSSKADDEVKPTRLSLTRAVMFIILFNVVLLCATISGYFYLASMDKSIHARIGDFLIIGGATIAIPLLYGLGDLSKGKPNFYYI
ncbi:uncharacterized protein [Drosophila bipectinata]|uniref:uncharacterized protein n=1 Tax=Drosophila bipectinata TaxID=42026 RepID=UPI001C8A604B|nr:uncharacterized protein LOC108130754 [Drosophila bipectinata]